MSLKSIFVYGPALILVLTFFAFVLRSGVGVRAQAIWSIALLTCLSKFFCFREFGGDAFTPEMPARTIWIWDWAYSGACILCVLSLLALPFRGRWRLFVLPVLAWGFAAWGLVNGLAVPESHEVVVSCDDLPAALDGYRIVQLSDLHISAAARRERTAEIVRRANACAGDLIVITGDIVDGTPETRYRDVQPLAGLSARDGVWAVTGNHERYSCFDSWRPYFDGWNLRFLHGDCAFPCPGLALGGIDDVQFHRQDVSAVFASATNGEFRVLLEHRPWYAVGNAADARLRLQLSGHTHGGVMPGMDEVVRRLNRGFVRGVYDLTPDGRSRLYVSPGTGLWAGFPIRFFNPPEITVITLRRAG